MVASCSPKIHRKPPETVGIRTNLQGFVSQRIVREISYTEDRIPVLTPDGPKNRTHGEVKYFLEELGKPRREITVMHPSDFSNYGEYWPINDSPLWVGTGINPVGNKDRLNIILFDENKVARTRTFSVVPKWKSSENEFAFQDGNRTMIIRSPDGLMKYNLVEDAVTKIEK